MGGASSRQRTIREAERIQAKDQDFNTYNFNADQYLVTNIETRASNSDNIPNQHYHLHNECSSSSRELQNTNPDAKSINNNIPNRLLPNSSNVNYYPAVESEFHQNMIPTSGQNYSKDGLVSNSTLRTQPIGIEMSRINNTYDEYVDLTNSSDSCEGCVDLANSLSCSTTTAINQNFEVNKQPLSKFQKPFDAPVKSQVKRKVPYNHIPTCDSTCSSLGITENSVELDKDEGSSSVECLSFQPLEKPLSNFEKLFDTPVKPQVEQKVLYNHIPTCDNTYSSLGITQPQYNHGNLCNSGYDKNCAAQSSGVKKSVNELNSDSYFDVLDILSFPLGWTSCALETTGFVDITPESDEGRSVLRLFKKTSVSGSFKLLITNLTRIENPFLHSLYMLKKEEMKSRNRNVDELYLYHGTKSENVDQISQDNLNWRLYTERHRFGRGVSFSPSAIYSSHYSDSSNKKVMFLYKVLVSNAVFGSSDMVIPSIESGVVFDTSIKDDTSVVVKYSDNEFYPLYIITYTRHSNV